MGETKSTVVDQLYVKYVSSYIEMYSRRKKSFSFENIQTNIADMKRLTEKGPEELLELLRLSQNTEITHCLETFRNSFSLVNDDEIESIEEIIQVLVYMISQEDQKESNNTLEKKDDRHEDET